MNLITKIMTLNDCYKDGGKITPKGIMVHSTASPGVMALDWFSRWNKPNLEKCVHAFLDDSVVMQSLPWNYRGWHCGGSANGTHIGFEICEPETYDKTYFDKAYSNAIDFAAYLCKLYGLTEKNIIGHYEGAKLGIASNHGDPKPLFSIYGKSMDDFRAEVKAKLNIETAVKGVSIDMENLVVWGKYEDKPDAERLADFLGCPILNGNIPYDYKGIGNVICVGGAPTTNGVTGWTGYATEKIAGSDRYETNKLVLKRMGKL